MIIYSESGEIIETPDLENGWVEIKTSKTVKEHHPAIPMKSHIEERDGKRIRVIDQHLKEEWDEYEEYGIYHPYEFSDQPSDKERIAALEERNAYLEEALRLLLSGETGEGAAEDEKSMEDAGA